MYKLLTVLAVVGLTACGSSASSDAATNNDSSAVVITATPDTTHADSSVHAPTADSLAK